MELVVRHRGKGFCEILAQRVTDVCPLSGLVAALTQLLKPLTPMASRGTCGRLDVCLLRAWRLRLKPRRSHLRKWLRSKLEFTMVSLSTNHVLYLARRSRRTCLLCAIGTQKHPYGMAVVTSSHQALLTAPSSASSLGASGRHHEVQVTAFPLAPSI